MMRTIAIIKKCLESEKKLILSSVEREDKVLFFDNEEELFRIEGDDTLEGKRVLILGTGNIGQETAKKLRCFGVHTVGICRTSRNKHLSFDEMYTIDNVDTQLKIADVVVIALPGTPETSGMFDAERIKMMKASAILVNVGRGFIVDTDELTKALQKGLLRGAILDVTEPEPLPIKHPLRYMENVLLTPHISVKGIDMV